MADLIFQGISIVGISSCVPAKKVNNQEYGSLLFNKETLGETIAHIGVQTRFISTSDTTTSDLCYLAAKDLFKGLNIDSTVIDAIIFVTQTPDYRLPATACILQSRLGCRKNIIAFDINLGCSGFVYGLGLSFCLLQQSTISKVLLLAGDTPTKFISNEDKSTALLFGDGGTATLIEKSGTHKSYFSMNSDGSGAKALIIPGGGYRIPSSYNTLHIECDDNNNQRSQEQLYMDGPEIFNFTIREIPKNINYILDMAKINMNNIDFFVFHQANKFILDYLAHKLKIPDYKCLISINNFGNTSSASIPLTITVNNELFTTQNRRIILSGFGVGFSWSSALINLDRCVVLPIQFQKNEV